MGSSMQRKSSSARGYGAAWQKSRASFLRTNPLCIFCKRHGLLTPASVVDHIIPHRGNQTIFWDSANWQPLCKLHHDSDKQLIEAGKRPRSLIGVDGYPIEPDADSDA